MMKKLLFTVSDDPNMFNGLRFLCRFFENKDRFDLTLLCMASPDSAACSGKGKADADSNWRQARDEAMRLLQWNGFKPDLIRVKNAESVICRIEDIEDELGSETYDALVMGRRGLDRLRDFTQKSLSQKLFESHPDIPLMLCRQPDMNRRNVLLCVDGSQSSESMARFVASMLQGESHLVTLCNIIKDTEDERDKSLAIFRRCEEIMGLEGLGPNRVHHMIYPSDYAPRAILDNAHWGKYAVVAVGGISSRGKDMFYGSVTRYLFTELTDAVLWIHP